MALRGDAVVVVMPTPATGATGPVATWITAAGWAKAARDRWGNAWLVTPEGVLAPEEARALATAPRQPVRPRSGWRRRVPTLLGTVKKDLRDLLRAWRFRNAALDGPWLSHRVAFVVQHHEIFQWAGIRAARRSGVPVVLFVDAPLVWEASKWNVRRPGWGGLLERYGETPQLRSSDLVACVSEEVARKVVELGAPEERVLVTPCSVDVDDFAPGPHGDAVRQRHGLEGRFVVGWVGSFRRFHGIDLLLRAFASAFGSRSDVALLLVGDGFERPRMEQMAAELRIHNAVFTGGVPHSEVAAHMSAMDVATVVDPGHGEFHYSPLKIREYMACGRAVVAPRSGQLARFLGDGDAALLVPPGDVQSLTQALTELEAQPDLRRSLGLRARALIERVGTWHHQISRVEQALEGLGFGGAP